MGIQLKVKILITILFFISLVSPLFAGSLFEAEPVNRRVTEAKYNGSKLALITKRRGNTFIEVHGDSSEVTTAVLSDRSGEIHDLMWVSDSILSVLLVTNKKLSVMDINLTQNSELIVTERTEYSDLTKSEESRKTFALYDSSALEFQEVTDARFVGADHALLSFPIQPRNGMRYIAVSVYSLRSETRVSSELADREKKYLIGGLIHEDTVADERIIKAYYSFQDSTGRLSHQSIGDISSLSSSSGSTFQGGLSYTSSFADKTPPLIFNNNIYFCWFKSEEDVPRTLLTLGHSPLKPRVYDICVPSWCKAFSIYENMIVMCDYRESKVIVQEFNITSRCKYDTFYTRPA